MLTVIERKNESIEVTNPVGEVSVYLPSYDLAPAKVLLEGLNALRTRDGTALYAAWQYKGYYLYPALQEWLFWHVCVALVRHQKAWNDLRGHEMVFEQEPFYTASTLKNISDILLRRRNVFERGLYNVCAGFLRYRALPTSSVVVYDDGLEGFRYRKLKSILADMVPYSRLETLHSYSDAIKLFKDRKALCLGKKAWRYPAPPSVNYASATFLHPYLSEEEFKALIDAIHRRCCDKLAEIPAMEKVLLRHQPSLVIGYDQVEEATAYIIACKLRGIPVVTYQHGLFTEYHAGWNAPGIPSEYCNVAADTLVVWGDYWKQILLKHSNKYGEKQIVVGAHLRNDIAYVAWPKPKASLPQPLTILLPYEFLADNIAISAYLRRFLALGWNVWIKMRPVGAGDQDDRLSYDEDIRDKIVYVDAIGADEMEKVDVVAFTQSTFAYEMMPYNKPLWYLDTPFRFFDVVGDGIAYNITHDLVDRLSEPELLKTLLQPRYTQDHYKAVFSDHNLRDVVQRLIDNSLNVSRASR